MGSLRRNVQAAAPNKNKGKGRAINTKHTKKHWDCAATTE